MIGLLWWLQPKAHSYDKVLGDSFLFYEAHRSGVSLRPPHGEGPSQASPFCGRQAQMLNCKQNEFSLSVLEVLLHTRLATSVAGLIQAAHADVC